MEKVRRRATAMVQTQGRHRSRGNAGLRVRLVGDELLRAVGQCHGPRHLRGGTKAAEPLQLRLTDGVREHAIRVARIELTADRIDIAGEPQTERALPNLTIDVNAAPAQRGDDRAKVRERSDVPRLFVSIESLGQES